MTLTRPKLIFINRFFYPDESATAQILTDLVQELAESGWVVHVITSKAGARDAAPALHDNIRVSRLWSTRLGSSGSIFGKAADYLSFYVSALVAIICYCRSGDIVIAKTDPPLISIAALAAARLKGGTLINWLQDLYPEVAIELGVGSLSGRIGTCLIALRNKALRGAAANVVIGQRMADRLVSMGVDRDRIHLIPNWADDETIRPIAPGASRLRQEWRYSAQDFVLGYSGNLGRAHEASTLIEAAKLLAHRKHIQFLFIGGGHERANLQATVARLGLSNFAFKDYQPRERLSDSLGAPDAHWLSLRPELEGLIVPSKFYGIAAAGRPVIAVTAVDGEVANMIRAYSCGHVIKPGDAGAFANVILTLAEDKEERLAMGARARLAIDQAYARRFVRARWEAVLDSVRPSSQGSGLAKRSARPLGEEL